MTMDFSGSAGQNSPINLIPDGQLAWAILEWPPRKIGPSGNGFYPLVLTIDADQPFARRKILHNLMDPFDQNHKEQTRQIATAAITHMIESARWGARLGFDQAAFQAAGGYRLDSLDQLNGARVAIKIGIEAGQAGYDDKNRVSEWLTPNPGSKRGHKPFTELLEGKFNRRDPAAPQQAGFQFGGAPAAQGGFAIGGASPMAAAALAQQAAPPLTQQAPEVAAQPPFAPPSPTPGAPAASPAGTGQGAAASSSAAFPSEPAAPLWLRQTQQ